jgi:hypothetical protein
VKKKYVVVCWFAITAFNMYAGGVNDITVEYTRSRIPEYNHNVLKSGCAIEKLQERSIEKTMALILMYSIVAGKILNMTYAGRLTPGLPCSLLLEEDEWKLLYCIADKVKKEPKKPYTIKEAVDYFGARIKPPQGSPANR